MPRLRILAAGVSPQGLVAYTKTLDQACCEGVGTGIEMEGTVIAPETDKIMRRLTVSIVTEIVDH